ncbi:unnamed protein product [Bemisia tabaci]|uniref:UDP-D-xylose:beta-D-glucoside alpha-1,3-D-xylosyltransferase n=1 Tax=Bemisia tabaci TaxID=7038 RepID=A0A9P0ADS2_BEMTA|nr:unnamed protein product [Bemisia tabaci]
MASKFKVRKKLYVFVALAIIGLILFTKDFSPNVESAMEDHKKERQVLEKPQEFVLGVVACGNRTEEALVMIKSALVLKSTMLLKLLVVTEEPSKKFFEEKLTPWVILMNDTFTFEIHLVSFPSTHEKEWRHMFKLCASQRLFFPDLLPHIDSLLYVDTDTLFLTPLTNIWKHFSLMNSTQLAALAPEGEDENVGWYNRFAQHPYPGRLGLNSGVMLMNLTRMRTMGWTKYLAPIYEEFKHKLTWGDQDIINIIFSYHPECLYMYPCSYNFRSDHCIYTSICLDAEENGINVMHGSRGAFQKKQPAFMAVYKAFKEYQLGTDPFQNLMLPMQNNLDAADVSSTNCGKIRHVYLKNLATFFQQKFRVR